MDGFKKFADRLPRHLRFFPTIYARKYHSEVVIRGYERETVYLREKWSLIGQREKE